MNEHLGATAYGSVTGRAQTEEQELAAATQMVLQGRRGLLKEWKQGSGRLSIGRSSASVAGKIKAPLTGRVLY